MIRMPDIRSRQAVALCAVALAVTPVAAHAQFGKLRDLGKAAAGQVAGKKVEEGVASRAAAADPTAEARPRNVTFTEDVIEITAARLEQLARGFDAEEAARPAAEQRMQATIAAARERDRTYEARRAAYDREYAAWDKRNSAIDACVEKVQAKYEGSSAADEKRSEQIGAQLESEMTDAKQARMQRLAERMKAANDRGDMATVRVLNDSLQRELAGVMAASREGMAMSQRAAATTAAMEKEVKACGTRTPAPQSPNAGGFVDENAARYEAAAAGAKAAGLSDRQYAVLRERVEGYARLKGRTGRSSYAYTAAELQVLSSEAAQRLYAKPGFASTASWTPEPTGE
jgi:hypothetical protein